MSLVIPVYIDRQERICDFCNDSCIEDEFISLEMPVPSQGHYGFHSFSVVD
jgi:hypothetical protein